MIPSFFALRPRLPALARCTIILTSLSNLTPAKVFGIPEDIQSMDALPTVSDTQPLLERYARLKQTWDEIDPGTDLLCLPLPIG